METADDALNWKAKALVSRAKEKRLYAGQKYDNFTGIEILTGYKPMVEIPVSCTFDASLSFPSAVYG